MLIPTVRFNSVSLAFLIDPTLVVGTYFSASGFSVCLTTLLSLFSNSNLYRALCDISISGFNLVSSKHSIFSVNFLLYCASLPCSSILCILTRRTNESTAGLFLCFWVQVFSLLLYPAFSYFLFASCNIHQSFCNIIVFIQFLEIFF